MLKYFKELNDPFFKLLKREPRTIFLIQLIFFLLYFTYSTVRSATEALFVHQSGASKTPFVWLLSVCTLSISIVIYNKLQSKIGLKKYFFWTGVFTSLIFCLFIFLNQAGVGNMTYALFVIKEVYIVLLVHLALAYCNNYFTISEAKSFYGPFGAVGSIGSTAGGLFSSWWVSKIGSTFALLYFSMAGITCLSFVFLLLQAGKDKSHYNDGHDFEAKFVMPIKSLKEVKLYIAFIILIVALSQFFINVANLQFNLKFAEIFTGSLDEKTAYMGSLYTYIGLLTFLVQVLLVSPILTYVKSIHIHIGIPLFFLAVGVLSFYVFKNSLWVLSASFIIYKSIDYSLFSSAKEMLYFNLRPEQKIGGKYLVDMVVYRLSKGVISITLIYFQSPYFLTLLLFAILTCWILTALNLNIQNEWRKK